MIDIIKKKVIDTIAKYSMVNTEDRLIVAVSGGKDSTVLLDILSEYYPRMVHALHLDVHIPSYGENNLNNIKSFCSQKGIPLFIVSLKDVLGITLSQAKEKLKNKGVDITYCSICGILKRYFLNLKAKEMSGTKIVTGHNIDDAAQSFLMNQFKGNISMSLGLGPVSGAGLCKGFVQRIKPLYFINEDDLKTYSKAMNFPVVYESCPYSSESLRNKLKERFNYYLKKNPNAKENLVNFYLNNIGRLKFQHSREFSYCKCCGEPSSKDRCNACRLIEQIKG
jgi:uncharacterized protein (TIGR00269 family)